jgi:hypothetical protein
MREREGLITRIRQIRRVAAAADTRSTALATNPDPAPPPDSGRVDALEARIAELEQMVEGLQDSVHRETRRHRRRIAELEAQIQPAALGAALNRDARERGL